MLARGLQLVPAISPRRSSLTGRGEPLLGFPLPALSFGFGNRVAHGHRLQQHLFGGDKGVARVIG
jgi:hypothetical protein